MNYTGDADAPTFPSTRHFAVAALAYTAFVVYGSFVPLQFESVPLSDAIDQFRRLPPPSVGLGNRADWGSNVLLFIPFTFLWMGVLTCRRPDPRRIGAALLVTVFGLIAAVAVEFGQIWFSGRTPSLSDVSAESIGSVIGMALWLLAGSRVVAWLREVGANRAARWQYQWMLELYLVGFVVYSLVPLDLTMSIGDLYHKYTDGLVVLVPFTYPYESWSSVVYQFGADVLELVPAGAWFALTQRHRWPRGSAVIIGAVGGGLIAFCIECAQLLVISRYTDTTDIVLGVVGGALGGWLVGRFDPEPSHDARIEAQAGAPAAPLQWLLAIAAYSLLLMVGFWFPFEIRMDPAWVRPRLDLFFGVPLFTLYWSSILNATSQLLIRLLLYAPLGALWARLAATCRSAAARSLLTLFGIAYAVALALGIELVQVAMPGKVADATEVMLASVGAVGGVLLARRLIGSSDSTASRP